MTSGPKRDGNAFDVVDGEARFAPLAINNKEGQHADDDWSVDQAATHGGRFPMAPLRQGMAADDGAKMSRLQTRKIRSPRPLLLDRCLQPETTECNTHSTCDDAKAYLVWFMIAHSELLYGGGAKKRPARGASR